MAVTIPLPRRRHAVPPSPHANPGATCYAVTVDTEEEWDWAGGFPTRPPSVANVARLPEFQAVCEEHGAAVTYFCNHAVLADPAARDVIQRLAERPNVEIGLHVHPWNTPPVAVAPAVPVRDSFLHNLPWDVARAKLDATLEAFDRAGLRPTSFRGGRYSTSPRIQEYLRDHGVLADASVLPFSTWEDDGAPDYRGRDLAPVRHPPRRPGDRALWELPLTFGYTRRPFRAWGRVIAAGERGPLRRLRLVGLLGRLGVVRKAWLNLENPLCGDVRDFLRVLRGDRPPFACFTLHSSSLMPGGSPYARTEADADRLLAAAADALAQVAGWPEFVPATVTQTALHLETAYHARARD